MARVNVEQVVSRQASLRYDMHTNRLCVYCQEPEDEHGGFGVGCNDPAYLPVRSDPDAFAPRD